MRRSVSAAASLFLTLVATGAAAQTCDIQPGSSDAPGREPTKLALLVGVGDYQASSITKLLGPPNDVNVMKQLLETSFEFPAENVRVLLEGEATRQAILDAFCTHLVGRARADDTVVFYYSGHGSRMGDREPFDESDGYDETLVPIDSRLGGKFDIRDDEIHDLIDQLATTNITLVLDSCHSGTGARAIATPRVAPPDPRVPRRVVQNGTRGIELSNGFRPVGGRYVLLTGARADQRSYETAFPEGTHGVLTYHLNRALKAAATKQEPLTYRDIFEPMAAEMDARFPDQDPQLEGANADNLLFGNESALAPPYILVAPAGQNVNLKAGSVHGVTSGSKYAVYAPGTRDFSAAQPVARIEVTEVAAFEATARRLEGEEVLEQASRAVETEHNYGESHLRVFLDATVSPDLADAIEAALGANHNIEFIGSGAEADMALAPVPLPPPDAPDIRVSEIALYFPDGSQASSGIPLNRADAPAGLAKQLRDWSKWFGVLRLSNPQPQLTAKVEIQRRNDAAQPATTGEEAGTLLLKAGDKFTLTVHNTSDMSLFVHVLDLASDGSINPVFPLDSGAANAIEPGQKWNATYNAKVAKDRTQVRGVVKVVLSTDPIDIRGLFQPGIKAAKNLMNPLERVLDNAATGARESTTTEVGDWLAAERTILVRK